MGAAGIEVVVAGCVCWKDAKSEGLRRDCGSCLRAESICSLGMPLLSKKARFFSIGAFLTAGSWRKVCMCWSWRVGELSSAVITSAAVTAAGSAGVGMATSLGSASSADGASFVSLLCPSAFGASEEEVCRCARCHAGMAGLESSLAMVVSLNPFESNLLHTQLFTAYVRSSSRQVGS